MPEAGREGAELVRGADPGSRVQDAPPHEREDVGAELNRALEDRIFDPDPEVRSLAVSLTPGLEDPVPTDLLIAALDDSCPDVVVAAAEALVQTRAKRATDAVLALLTTRPELRGPLALVLAGLEGPALEEPLIRRIEEGDTATRIALLRALGSSGTALALSEILPFLDCGDRHTEREALLCLARIHARAPNAVSLDGPPWSGIAEKLDGLLGSADARDRTTAVALIALLRPARGVSLLLDLLESNVSSSDGADGAVRERAMEALAVVSCAAEEEALHGIARLADRAPGLAAEALDRIATLRDEKAQGVCLGLTRHADARVRERAAALAGRVGGRNAANALLLLTGDPIGHVRAQAAEALGLLRWTDAGSCLESLLGDPYPDVRRAALFALRSIRDHEVDAEKLFEHAQPGASRAAALRACDPRRAGASFDRAVADPDVLVRMGAAMSLNERGTWLESASALLRDEDPRVRAHALTARLRAAEELGLGALRGFLGDPDAGVRQSFAAGLEEAIGAERTALLHELLSDACPAVGRAAARSLARHPEPSSVSALLDAVSTGTAPVAAQAIESLGILADPEALPRLRAVARGGDATLREAAAHAVRRIEETQA